MGNGKKLEDILYEKRIRVADLARITKMNPKTLYAIISRDSNIRYDFALRIAKALDVDISEICDGDMSFYSDILLERKCKWIIRKVDNFRKYEYKCSLCNGKIMDDYDQNTDPDDFVYCPFCGAKIMY